jgi:hypothetical protein
MLYKKKWIFFLISVMTILNLMCGFGARDFDQSYFTTIEPKPENMAGTYVPNNETMTLIRETGHYNLTNISISLFVDGTFTMNNMPDWWMTTGEKFGESNGGTDSGKGKWSIFKSASWWQIGFEFESATFNSREDLVDGFYTSKDIGEDQPPYTLWFYVGDADHGRVMIFEQIIEKP